MPKCQRTRTASRLLDAQLVGLKVSWTKQRLKRMGEDVDTPKVQLKLLKVRWSLQRFARETRIASKGEVATKQLVSNIVPYPKGPWQSTVAAFVQRNQNPDEHFTVVDPMCASAKAVLEVLARYPNAIARCSDRNPLLIAFWKCMQSEEDVQLFRQIVGAFIRWMMGAQPLATNALLKPHLQAKRARDGREEQGELEAACKQKYVIVSCILFRLYDIQAERTRASPAELLYAFMERLRSGAFTVESDKYRTYDQFTFLDRLSGIAYTPVSLIAALFFIRLQIAHNGVLGWYDGWKTVTARRLLPTQLNFGLGHCIALVDRWYQGAFEDRLQQMTRLCQRVEFSCGCYEHVLGNLGAGPTAVFLDPPWDARHTEEGRATGRLSRGLYPAHGEFQHVPFWDHVRWLFERPGLHVLVSYGGVPEQIQWLAEGIRHGRLLVTKDNRNRRSPVRVTAKAGCDILIQNV